MIIILTYNGKESSLLRKLKIDGIDTNFIPVHNRRNQNPPLSPVYTCNNSLLLRPAVLFAGLAIPRLTGLIVWRGERNSIVDRKCHSSLRCVPVPCFVGLRHFVFYVVFYQLWYLCSSKFYKFFHHECRPRFAILVRQVFFWENEKKVLSQNV